jgi:hypothetical protein
MWIRKKSERPKTVAEALRILNWHYGRGDYVRRLPGGTHFACRIYRDTSVHIRRYRVKGKTVYALDHQITLQ